MHDPSSTRFDHALVPAAGRRLRFSGTALVLLVAWSASASAEDAAKAFVPGEISIGEPIVLPATPAMPPAAAPVPATTATAVPGNGWLGIVIDESPQPGRWIVAEVLPESPAARAGIRAGDEVRAINGTVLRNADDAAQALTTIAAGQTVDVAIARAEGVQDVRLIAMPRPASPPARDGRATAGLEPARSPAPFEQPASVLQPESIPVPAVAGPAVAGALPPAVSPGPASAPAFLPPRAAGDAPATRMAPAAGQWAAAPAAATVPAARGRIALGVRTVPIDQQTQARFRLPAARGAYVIGVVQDLPASRAGVPPGSVIVALDRRPVTSPDQLTDLVTSGPVGRPVTLDYMLPGGVARTAEVVLQSLDVPLERAFVNDPPAAERLPYRSERPVDGAAIAAAREEVRRLRARLDALERLLQGAAPERP